MSSCNIFDHPEEFGLDMVSVLWQPEALVAQLLGIWEDLETLELYYCQDDSFRTFANFKSKTQLKPLNWASFAKFKAIVEKFPESSKDRIPSTRSAKEFQAEKQELLNQVNRLLTTRKLRLNKPAMEL